MQPTSRRQFISAAALLAPGLGRRRATVWRMPAEEMPHAQTWMCFPASRSVWGPDLPAVQATIGEIVRAISDFEPVSLLTRPAAKARARTLVGRHVTLLDAPVDDLWARDTLPCFLTSRSHPGKLRAGLLRFNGWGGKQLHGGDARLNRLVAEHVGAPVVESGLTGEGGALEIDGAGTLLAARSSWVNRNRNPQLDEHQIGARLKALVGAERIIWVDGVAGRDITDSHIDTLARFIDPETILVEDPGTTDIWGRVAKTTRRQLADADAYAFVTLKQPASLPSGNPDFLASYVNYYVCNDAVIMPAFGDRKADDRAKSQIGEAYPGRQIVQLRIDAVAAGGGGIHCATQQQPHI